MWGSYPGCCSSQRRAPLECHPQVTPTARRESAAAVAYRKLNYIPESLRRHRRHTLLENNFRPLKLRLFSLFHDVNAINLMASRRIVRKASRSEVFSFSNARTTVTATLQRQCNDRYSLLAYRWRCYRSARSRQAGERIFAANFRLNLLVCQVFETLDFREPAKFSKIKKWLGKGSIRIGAGTTEYSNLNVNLFGWQYLPFGGFWILAIFCSVSTDYRFAWINLHRSLDWCVFAPAQTFFPRSLVFGERRLHSNEKCLWIFAWWWAFDESGGFPQANHRLIRNGSPSKRLISDDLN